MNNQFPQPRPVLQAGVMPRPFLPVPRGPPGMNQMPLTMNQMPLTMNQMPLAMNQMPLTMNQMPLAMNQIPLTMNPQLQQYQNQNFLPRTFMAAPPRPPQLHQQSATPAKPNIISALPSNSSRVTIGAPPMLRVPVLPTPIEVNNTNISPSSISNTVVAAYSAPQFISRVPEGWIPRLTATPSERDDMILWIGKIPSCLTEETIKKMFQICGNIIEWKRPVGVNNELKPFGFVTFEHSKNALKCFRTFPLVNIGPNNEKIEVKAGSKETLKLQIVSKLEEESIAEENALNLDAECKSVKTLDEIIIKQLIELVIIPKDIDQTINTVEVISSKDTCVDVDKNIIPNSSLLSTSIGNLANAYDEIDNFDPLNSNIVVSEIEKFRIRQNIRDKEAEEQRKIKLNEKIKQVMLAQVNQAADLLIQDAINNNNNNNNEPNNSQNHIDIHSNSNRNIPMESYNRQDNRRDNFEKRDRINNDSKRDRDEDDRRDRDGNNDKRKRYDMQDEEFYRKKRIETLEMLSSNGKNQKQTEEFEEKRRRRLEVLELMKANSSSDKGSQDESADMMEVLINSNTSTSSQNKLINIVSNYNEVVSPPVLETCNKKISLIKNKPKLKNKNQAFSIDQDEKETKSQRELVMLDYSNEDLEKYKDEDEDESGGYVIKDEKQEKAINAAKAISDSLMAASKINSRKIDEDKIIAKQKEIVNMIPKEKELLFSYSLDWNIVASKNLLKVTIHPWLEKKMVEYLGEVEPVLIEFILTKLASQCAPDALIVSLKQVFAEDSEQFVIKLWRMLIFSILKENI